MKRNTMKGRIIKSNIIVIVVLIVLTTIVFNIAIKIYFKNEIRHQLYSIAMQAENTALRKGPDFLQIVPPPKPKDNGFENKPGEQSTSPGNISDDAQKEDDTKDSMAGFPSFSDNPVEVSAANQKIFEFYFLIDRSLRQTLSVVNADFLLIDSNKKIINTNKDGYFDVPDEFISEISAELEENINAKKEYDLSFTLSGTEYLAIVKPVSHKNSFGLGWIVIYSSLQQVHQLKIAIIFILLIILIISSLVTVVISSKAAKKISEPFSTLSRHLSELSERNFCVRLDVSVPDELTEVVRNVNIMAEKLEQYDKAQQTFLQNASHEFRTPLMSIQSYAEAIKYDVMDSEAAVDIILSETRRMANLVEDLMYLSRLVTIDENYHFSNCTAESLIRCCIDRMGGIAIKNNIKISFNNCADNVLIYADEEKLSRAITNIIANDIRYASSRVQINLKKSEDDKNFISLHILDDGPGFEQDELPSIFDRFYKGKKGNYGLGLAIAKNVVEKHNGRIFAANTESGALFIIELPVSQSEVNIL